MKNGRDRRFLNGDVLRGVSNRWFSAFGFLCAAFMLFYLVPLTRFTLSIDDELAGVRENADVWLSQGRWTVYILETFLITQPIVPFVPLAIFGVLSVVGYLFLMRSMGKSHPDFTVFFVFPLFIAFPPWVYLTTFLANAPAVGLSVMLTGVVAYLFRWAIIKPTRWYFTLSGIGHVSLIVFLGAVAVGGYQSFFLAVVVSTIAVMVSLYHVGRRPGHLFPDALFAGTVWSSISAVYFLVNFAFLLFSSASVDYIDSFIRFDIIFAEPASVIQAVFHEISLWYFLGGEIHGRGAWVLGLFLAVSIAGFGLSVYQKWGLVHGGIAAVAVVGMLVLPFMFHLLAGGHMPARSMVAVPFAVTGLATLWFRYGNPSAVRMSSMVLLLVYGSFFLTHSSLHAAREMVWLHDRNLAAAIGERLELVSGGSWDSPRKIDFMGFRVFESPFHSGPEDSTIGASFFSWDQATPKRITAFMRILGLPPLTPIVEEERWLVLDELYGMPEWPLPGSVRLSSTGVLLVRLSRGLDYEYRALLSQKDPHSAGAGDPFFANLWSVREGWEILHALNWEVVGRAIRITAQERVVMVLTTGSEKELTSCRRIQLHAEVSVTGRTVFQVWFKPPGQSEFDIGMMAEAVVEPVETGRYADVFLQLMSAEGFADSFRVVPAWHPQEVWVRDLSFTCREGDSEAAHDGQVDYETSGRR